MEEERAVKRNYIMALLILCLCLFIVGCANTKNTEGTDNNGNVSAEEKGEKKIKLKLGTFQSATSSMVVETLEPFMERVTEMTDGQVEFEFYPAEQLGKAADTYDLTANGVMDIGLYLAPYSPSEMPISSSIPAMPGIYTTAYQGSMAYHKMSKESPILETDFLNGGVRPIFTFASIQGELLTKGKEIKVPKDLTGLKIRPSGEIARKVVADLGGTSVNMAIPELYEGLERNVIDAIHLYAVSAQDNGLDELVKFGTEGLTLGGAISGLIINEKKFQSLPKDVQEVLIQVGDEFTESNATYYDELNSAAVQEYRDAGVNIHTLSEDEKDQWQKVYDKVIEEWLKEKENSGIEEVLRTFNEEIKAFE